MIPENKVLCFLLSGSKSGKKIKKYKIRLIKEKFIDKEAAKRNEWTIILKSGYQIVEPLRKFSEKWYLDEIPQFFNILIGDMSFVGPRPLSVIHYEEI